FKLVAKFPHEEAMREMKRCDVVIDQVNEFGVYGMVAVEAMALGKVVLSSIRPDYYQNCPIVDVRGLRLDRALSDVLETRDSWPATGRAGRNYVGEIHDPARIA